MIIGLKNIDTGVMDEPPVHYWVMGANEWRSGATGRCRKRNGRSFISTAGSVCRLHRSRPSSVEEELPADAFVQMPPTQTNGVQRLRYLTDPLPADVLVVGPSVVNLFAEIDQDDTNWFVTFKT